MATANKFLGGPVTGGYSVSSVFGGLSGVGPFLVPATATPGQDIVVNLVAPLVAGVAAGPVALPTLALTQPTPLLATQSVFSAQIVTPPGPRTGPRVSLPMLQITANAPLPWSAAAADRAALLVAFRVFQAQLEALELVAGSPLVAGCAEMIANRVAASLPLRYDEVLAFFYGFDPAGQTIDVSAGMALQVAWAGYQYGDGPGGPNEGSNGLVTTGQTMLDVVRRSDFRLAFDGFSGLFNPGIQLQPANPAPPPNSPVLAGGPLDLQLGGNARRHFKLLWPATFPASNSTEAPGAISLGCQLIGADTYADLATAVGLVQAAQNGSITQSNGKPVVVIGFTGRVTIVPCVRTWINGVLQSVALGTTVRNAAQRIADLAPWQMANSGAVSFGLSRWTQASGKRGGEDIYLLGGVDFTGADQAIGACGDGFDLPLLKGDVLVLDGAAGGRQ